MKHTKQIKEVRNLGWSFWSCGVWPELTGREVETRQNFRGKAYRPGNINAKTVEYTCFAWSQKPLCWSWTWKREIEPELRSCQAQECWDGSWMPNVMSSDIKIDKIRVNGFLLIPKIINACCFKKIEHHRYLKIHWPLGVHYRLVSRILYRYWNSKKLKCP